MISNKLKTSHPFKAYNTFCDGYVGQSGAPLSLVSSSTGATPVVAPALVDDQSFSLECGLVAQEIVHRLSHVGDDYCADNKTLFSQLVTATLGTSYASIITCIKRAKNGHRALKGAQCTICGRCSLAEQSQSSS